MMVLPVARSVAPKGTPCSPFVAACRPPEPPRARELVLPAYELPRRSTYCSPRCRCCCCRRTHMAAKPRPHGKTRSPDRFPLRGGPAPLDPLEDPVTPPIVYWTDAVGHASRISYRLQRQPGVGSKSLLQFPAWACDACALLTPDFQGGVGPGGQVCVCVL